MKRVPLIRFRGDRSQAEMADRYKVSQQTWSYWENGITIPSVAVMKQLERDSGVPMDVLFYDAFNK